VNRHLLHEHYNFEYLGLNWNNPPKTTERKLIRATAPVVETGLTVPVTTLALAVLGGIVLAGRRRGEPVGQGGDGHDPETAATPAAKPSWLRPGDDVDRAPGVFMAVQILGPLAVLTVPSTPIFGGVKHFMTAMPFIALAAGIGLRWVSRVLVEEIADGEKKATEVPALTGRERQVLSLIAEGLLNKQMADRLGIGVRTIETHRERIMRKLEIHTVAGLTKYALSQGMTSMS
jgi:DNA-binding CsgD family transcriptional regulator